MPIANSHLIAPHYPINNVFARANGVTAERAGTAILIAWLLEEAALQRGWQVGSSLGTINKLIEQFGVNRDTLREAIRVMEARGSMHMVPGRMGGLRLLSPCVDDVAAAFATYLQAIGYSEGELVETAAVAHPVLGMLEDGNVITQLFRQTEAMFRNRTAIGAEQDGRGRAIAARLIQLHGIIPENGVRLGDAFELCDKLGCTRPALREALRVLGDLAMIQVHRGRGGGYSLVRPSPDGTVRRIFGLIAARHITHDEMVPSLWALNLIRLRLAMRALARLDDQARERHCDMLESDYRNHSEPERWYNLQQNFGLIIKNQLVDVLTEGVMTYLSRVRPIQLTFDVINEPLFCVGIELIAALRSADYFEAERMHLLMHSQISAHLNCSDFPKSETMRRANA
jgi:DNA-binding FadR family transcriptional regulator